MDPQYRTELLSDLTRRQLQLLRLIADGYTSREIAEILDVAPKTVENRRITLYRSLGVNNAVKATRCAIRGGLVDA